MPIKYFDMFAGIGGFRSGLEAIGGFECVGYCEIDKYAKQAYEAMYDTGGETLLENDIYSAYIAMMSKLKRYKSDILDNMINQLEYIEETTNPNQASISAIDKQIADLSTQNLMIARLHTKSILSESEFSKQALEINSKISKLRSKRKLLLNDDSSEETISNLKHLSEIIDNFDYRDGFNEEMFSDTVEQIKAGYDNKLVFTLSGGLELTEIIK